MPEIRKQRCNLPLTEAEYAQICSQSKKEGFLWPSTFVRKIILDYCQEISKKAKK